MFAHGEFGVSWGAIVVALIVSVAFGLFMGERWLARVERDFDRYD